MQPEYCRAIAQTVSRRLITTEPRVQSQDYVGFVVDGVPVGQVFFRCSFHH